MSCRERQGTIREEGDFEKCIQALLRNASAETSNGYGWTVAKVSGAIQIGKSSKSKKQTKKRLLATEDDDDVSYSLFVVVWRWFCCPFRLSSRVLRDTTRLCSF